MSSVPLLTVPIYLDYWENEAEPYSGPLRQELESVIRDLPDVKARVRFAERFQSDDAEQGQAQE
jgi:hypothetical protein